MSTVKISELPVLTALSANNANTIFVAVDRDTQTTGQFSTTTLASAMFANNILNVGTTETSNFEGLIAQFIANNAPYGQVNYQNIDPTASMDIVITCDTGDDANNFLDLGMNGSDFTDPTYSSMKQKDGYLFVTGSSASDHVGNLVIGTTTSKTNVLFAVGGTTELDVTAKINKDGLIFVNGSTLTFDDGSVQSTAAATKSYSERTNANTIVSQGVDATQNTNITAVNTYAASAYGAANTNATNIGYVNTYAGSAYNKANNALANTDGLFTAGTLNVSKNLTVNGTMVLANSNFNSTESAVTISATPTVATPSNDGYMLHISGKEGVPSRIVFDSYGSGAYGLVAGRTARGTVASPTAVANNDVLMRISGNGHGGTGAGWTTTGVARIDIVATENYSATNRGSQIQFWNVPVGSNTLQQIATFNGDSVNFTGVVSPAKGFLFTPNVISSNVTTHTIDFNNDSLKKLQINADCTVTLSNFVVGKVVEVWVTNLSGSNRTFTHGVSELNSTNNSATVTIPATSSTYLRYFSIDGDLANTFVTVVQG